MDRILIRGGNRLSGRIHISGAKNAALTLMPCALLTDEILELRNLPRLADVDSFMHLLNMLGVSTMVKGVKGDEFGRVMTLKAEGITSTTAPYDMVRKMRASILVLGPLLARMGEATVSLPGGCAIGNRPIDLHLRAFQDLGAEIETAGGYVKAKAPGGRLPGGRISFPLVSVGATENALMAAVLASGSSVIHNAAREPEITDLAECLVAMGAKIDGIRTDTLEIEGVEQLHGASYEVMPDRIEAGSYACAAGITGGEVELVGARADTMAATMAALSDAGLIVEETGDGIRVASNGGIKPLSISTAPFPGLRHRHAGAVHGAADAGQGHQPAHRDHLRESLHARARAHPHGRGDRRARPLAVVRGVEGLVGAPGHGDGPARVDEPDHRRPRGRGRDPGPPRLPSRPRL
jgi:UDP-N-acetylglucosamine 1-carboxyvinyltransferase